MLRPRRLEFHADTHSYSLFDGDTPVARLPSVTQILWDCGLEDWSRFVPVDVLEAAREFGQHVHHACHLHDVDGLEWSTLDVALVPYVEAWRAFLEDTGAVVIASEQPVVHEELGYAGTPDRVLAWGARVVIPDLKATAAVPRTVGIQTSAYAKAYQAMRGDKKEPERYCIHLTAGGRGRGYKAHKRTDPADWSMFLSCLNVWKFRHVA